VNGWDEEGFLMKFLLLRAIWFIENFSVGFCDFLGVLYVF